MAIVLRPPLYVPNPPDDYPHRVTPRAAPLLVGMLTVGGQIPNWLRRFDIGDDSLWQGTPLRSWIIPTLTVGGKPPQPERKFDWQEDPLWTPAVQSNLALLARPFIAPPRHFDVSHDPVWSGQPDASPLLALLLTVGGQPRQPARKFDIGDDPLWFPAPPFNFALNNIVAARTQPFFNAWNYNQIEETNWLPTWPNLALANAGPPIVIPTGGVGKVFRKKYQTEEEFEAGRQRGFSRKWFAEFKAAELAAKQASQVVPNQRQRNALAKAVKAAENVRAEVELSPFVPDLQPLIQALHNAAMIQSVGNAIKASQEATEAARRVIEALRREQEDDEEAIIMLLH